MHTSTIHVTYGDGSPCSSTRVVLGFSGGMTKPAFTDNRGYATVAHASTGQATVYVSGRSYHSFRAPGQTSVTVR